MFRAAQDWLMWSQLLRRSPEDLIVRAAFHVAASNFDSPCEKADALAVLVNAVACSRNDIVRELTRKAGA